jgi:hypothetical protein
MSWDDVDNKHLRNYPDKSFVACDESYERKFIIDTILESFLQLSRSSIEAAVDHCCKTIPAPRPRKTFLQCVARQLGISYP